MQIPNSKYFTLFLTAICSILASPWARGESAAIKLSKLKEHIDISNSITVLEDPKSNLSIDKVLDLDDKFFEPEDDIANFGFSKSAWWAKFSIENDSS